MNYEQQKTAEAIRDSILDHLPKPYLAAQAVEESDVEYPNVDGRIYVVSIEVYDNPLLSEGDVNAIVRAHGAQPLEIVCSRDEGDGISEVEAYFSFTD